MLSVYHQRIAIHGKRPTTHSTFPFRQHPSFQSPLFLELNHTKRVAPHLRRPGSKELLLNLIIIAR